MDKYIKKINELYITNRKKYLVMLENGIYITGGKDSKGKIKKSLVDSDIKQHLEGKKTFGVFAGEQYSKFICFDIDVPDKNYAKWHAYKVIHTLVEIGIPFDKIYPSFSGNKGYHVEIFFNDIVSNNKIQFLFELTMEKAGYVKCEEYAYDCEGGKIELRPVGSRLGVKLPLGKHFKTKNQKRCWYVDAVTLKEIRRKSYLLEIEQINKEILDIIIESQKDLTMEEVEDKHCDFKNDIEELKEDIEKKYLPLPVYTQNIDESATYESIKKLEQEGLKQVGTRHNSLYKLAKVYRYEGFTREECENNLIVWMEKQDKSKYTTMWKECLKDIEQIVDYIYKNEISIVVHNIEIIIYEQEMLSILTLKKPCQKIFAFALLVHSKRFAQKDGIFYMTQKQLAETTRYNERTVRRELPVLEELGIFNYVSRNILIKHEYGQPVRKKPNRYKMNISFEDNGEVDIKRYVFDLVDHKQYQTSYKDSLLNLFDLTALKEMLPKRGYDELRKYKQMSYIA